MRGLTEPQRLILLRVVAQDHSAIEMAIPIEDARDLIVRGIAEVSLEGNGWHDINLEKASAALCADAAARAVGLWP
jgi:hypothetical protein